MWMETSKANMWIIECVAIKRSRKTSKLRGLYGTIGSDAIWKNHFCFLKKKTVFYDEKTWPPKKTLKKCFFFFFFFFYSKLCIKEKTKVVLLIAMGARGSSLPKRG